MKTGNISRKRIQNNDNEDGLESQKKNGGDIRNANQLKNKNSQQIKKKKGKKNNFQRMSLSFETKCISDLQDRMVEITAIKQNIEK